MRVLLVLCFAIVFAQATAKRQLLRDDEETVSPPPGKDEAVATDGDKKPCVKSPLQLGNGDVVYICNPPGPLHTIFTYEDLCRHQPDNQFCNRTSSRYVNKYFAWTGKGWVDVIYRDSTGSWEPPGEQDLHKPSKCVTSPLELPNGNVVHVCNPSGPYNTIFTYEDLCRHHPDDQFCNYTSSSLAHDYEFAWTGTGWVVLKKDFYKPSKFHHGLGFIPHDCRYGDIGCWKKPFFTGPEGRYHGGGMGWVIGGDKIKYNRHDLKPPSAYNVPFTPPYYGQRNAESKVHRSYQRQRNHQQHDINVQDEQYRKYGRYRKPPTRISLLLKKLS